jgi:glycosyltransferase involved in cell wall biosynthesis
VASKKLVFITSRFPFPIEKGDKLRAYYQLRDLSKDWEIHLISISDIPVSDEHLEAIRPFCAKIHVLRINKWMGYLRAFWGLFGRRPIQTYYFTSWKHKTRVKNLLKEIQPDHIFTQLIRSTEYVKNYHSCSKTLDYMDALSEGVQKRIPLAPWSVRWVFKSEWRKLMLYENVIFEYFENHLIISAQDRAQMTHPKRDAIHVLPNGVNENFLNYTSTSEPEFDICFVGNLSYPPNIEAVKFIVQEILPTASAQGVKLKCLISGANAGPQIMQFQNQVSITGWVDDIRQSYTNAKIFVAPMFIGTGLQNKLLEAMALGVPCITTDLAHRAVGCDTETISLANNNEEFVIEIKRLLEKEAGAEQAEKAKIFVSEGFNWHAINARLSELMRKSIQE